MRDPSAQLPADHPDAGVTPPPPFDRPAAPTRVHPPMSNLTGSGEISAERPHPLPGPIHAVDGITIEGDGVTTSAGESEPTLEGEPTSQHTEGLLEEIKETIAHLQDEAAHLIHPSAE